MYLRRILPVVACLVLAAGCQNTKSTSNGGSGSSSGASASAATDTASEDYYAEQTHDGRIYVFSNKKTYEAFQTTHHMPYTRTQIGAGPRGETLVFEIDKKHPEWTDWLQDMYAWKHKNDPKPYYAEIQHNGRYYVVGSKEMEAKFNTTHHLPYTRTFIAAGPGGKTVVVEVDKKDEGLTDWLVQQFEMKHGSLNR